MTSRHEQSHSAFKSGSRLERPMDIPAKAGYSGEWTNKNMGVLKKIDTFRRYPAGSVGAKLKKVYMMRLMAWWSKLQLLRAGLLGILAEFHKRRPPLSVKPEWEDLWFLYKNVRNRKPRVIWEFGSGCSTLVLTHALWKNSKEGAGGFMYSMDQDKFWGDSTRSLTPSFLLPFYKLIHSPVVEVEDGHFRHSVLPDVIPDFVYLDSPSFESDDERRRYLFSEKPAIAIDMLTMEHKLPNDFFMVVDCRRPNTRFLRDHLKRKYRFWRRKLIPQYVFELIE